MILIFLLHNAKESGNVLNILYLILFPINIFHPHIVSLCSNCRLCLFLKIYRRHLVIQSGGKMQEEIKPFRQTNYVLHKFQN
jgi:hypothetical protein